MVHSERIGETRLNKNGQKMTIIDYISGKDVTIELEGFGTFYHRRYARDFLKGELTGFKNKTFRIGEKVINNQGIEITLVAYRNVHDCDFKFSDGSFLEHQDYKLFKHGSLRSPKVLELKKEDLLNKKVLSYCGLYMKILNFRKYKDIDVIYEDGKIVEGVECEKFLKGNVKHPDFKFTYKHSDNYFGYELEYKFIINFQVYYLAKKDEFEGIMTLQEIYQTGSEINEKQNWRNQNC